MSHIIQKYVIFFCKNERGLSFIFQIHKIYKELYYLKMLVLLTILKLSIALYIHYVFIFAIYYYLGNVYDYYLRNVRVYKHFYRVLLKKKKVTTYIVCFINNGSTILFALLY